MTALFDQVQAGPPCTGTGSVLLTCASTADGTALVATVLCPSVTLNSARRSFTPPNPNWRFGHWAAAGAHGRLEVWYLEGDNQAGGLTQAVFTGPAGVTCEGGLSEWAIPAGYTLIPEGAGRVQNGTGGGTMQLATARGNAADCLGIAAWADFFTGPPSGGSWTLPAGYQQLQNVHSGSAACWYTVANPDLGQGIQSVTSGFSTTSGETGWCGVYLSFRAIRFFTVGLDGAEMSTNCAIDPTGTVLIVGGDVECRWSSTDFGDHWQTLADNAYGTMWSKNACIAWSKSEPNTVYAAVGDQSGGGGLLVSADGGATWSMRSTGVNFAGGGTGAAFPPRPAGQGQDTDRSVGCHILAEDAAGGHLYAAAFQAVQRSDDHGHTWHTINPGSTAQQANLYPRAIIYNPAAPREVWVACWQVGTGSAAMGGVWHTPDATVNSPVWDQLNGYTDTAADLLVLGGFLYVAACLKGLYRAKLDNPGTGALASLNGTGALAPGGILVDGTAKVTGIDGWIDGAGNHQVIVCQGDGRQPTGKKNFQNIIQVTLPGGATAGMTWTDLLNQAGATINLSTLPPDGRTWWRKGASWHYWLSGQGYTNGHVLVDPTNVNPDGTRRLYVTGSGGFYRSLDGGLTWELAVNGMPMWIIHTALIDPNNPGHIVIATSDFISVDLTDPTGRNPAAVKQDNPGAQSSESHVVTIDPVDSMVVNGLNLKYGSSDGGTAYARPGASPVNDWTDTGFAAAAGGPACIGIFAGRDASNHRFLLAVAQGKGLYRATSTVTSGVPATSDWTWTPPSGTAAAISANGNTGQIVPIVGKPGGTIYIYDRKAGIYRSTDYGVTWSLIWSKADSPACPTITDTSSGWLAINPNISGELWISTDHSPHGLYKLSGADTGSVSSGGITVTNITTGVPNPGGIAFYGGAIYVAQISTAAGPTSLQVSVDGGVTWADAGIPEIGSFVANTGQLLISPTGEMVLSAGFNIAVTGTLAASVLPPLDVATTTMQPGADGSTYPGTLAATGGTGTGYVWTLNSGSLPAGLALNGDGSFSGTITGSTSSFTVKVTDSGGHTAISGTLTITVAASTLEITNGLPPAGTLGSPYSFTLTAANGVAPYTWSIAPGALPAWATLHASTGVISGTPNKPGTSIFQVQVTDSTGATRTATFAITVAAGAITVTPPSLPVGEAGIPFGVTFHAVGGVPPFTWSAINTTSSNNESGTGSLPPGWYLNPETGTLTNPSPAPVSTSITVQAVDSVGSSGTVVLALTVNAGSQGVMVLANGVWVPAQMKTLVDGEWVDSATAVMSGGSWA